jgi:hypothetical protein
VAARVEREHQWHTETVLSEANRLVSALTSLSDKVARQLPSLRLVAIAGESRTRRLQGAAVKNDRLRVTALGGY